MLEDQQDAYGHAMFDYLNGKGGYEIVERDDGFFDISGGPELYFQKFPEWSRSEQAAMEFVHGKILDVGCGAGRHSLYLQERGEEVLGIDISPLAIKVCKARALRNTRVIPLTQVSRRLGVFDTILMLGNNFALVGNPKRALWLLRKFYNMTTEMGRIIVQTRDPYQTDIAEHLEYHAHKREHGKLSGEARIRVRYEKYVTPWIDFLMVSKDEMKALLEGTRWKVREFIDRADGVYITIIDKIES